METLLKGMPVYLGIPSLVMDIYYNFLELSLKSWWLLQNWFLSWSGSYDGRKKLGTTPFNTVSRDAPDAKERWNLGETDLGFVAIHTYVPPQSKNVATTILIKFPGHSQTLRCGVWSCPSNSPSCSTLWHLLTQHMLTRWSNARSPQNFNKLFNTYYIDMRYILTVAYLGINSGEIGRYLI